MFTDFNKDGWPDLVLAGEWMPLTFFRNDRGIFKNITANLASLIKLDGGTALRQEILITMAILIL